MANIDSGALFLKIPLPRKEIRRMKKSLRANAVLNVIKQLCSILFPLITIPYVSRVLQVANYGKIAFSSSFISYFSLLASLGITSYAIREGAIVRDKPERLKLLQNEVFTLNVYSTFFSYSILCGFLAF